MSEQVRQKARSSTVTTSFAASIVWHRAHRVAVDIAMNPA
jgi:hypothetical protein